MEWLYAIGIAVILWLMIQRWRAYQSLKEVKQGCASCRSLAVEDEVLTREECEAITKGDRTLLRKLGKRVVVRKEVPMGEPFKALVFLNDGFSGGQVRSDDQIVYPVVGRKVTGKIRSHQPAVGEQMVALILE
jgi:hypothetical protein